MRNSAVITRAATLMKCQLKTILSWGGAVLSVLVVFSTCIGVWPQPLEAAAPAAAVPEVSTQADDPSKPSQPVKLIFIHHSTGENWLRNSNGGLGLALMANNYFVSDTNYGWGLGLDPVDPIGSYTDIGNWYDWFGSGRNSTVLSALYAESGQNSSYSRLATDPGGPNEIILFKSCFPNSALKGSLSDPIPPIDSNPLKGQSSDSSDHTVSNAKGIYLDLLPYFASMPGKLFVVITAPPRVLANTTTAEATNARAFNEWLVDKTNGWLKDYTLNNVAVFDFYNVLTTNGGDAVTNDLEQETGNHHRWWKGAVQHISDGVSNMAAYPVSPTDDHPTVAGGQKATVEFVPLLNVFYHRWKNNNPAVPGTVTDLRLMSAITSTGQLAATLGWTPPANAITVTLRYSRTLITEANWAGATLLTSTLPPAATSYTATVPYSGGIVYFALKSQNGGGWSALSNNSVWAPRRTHLPLVRR